MIEYIGQIIRSEVAEKREKQYEASNRGVYMFRLDADYIVDATVCGGPARYFPSSNPTSRYFPIKLFVDTSIILVIQTVLLKLLILKKKKRL